MNNEELHIAAVPDEPMPKDGVTAGPPASAGYGELKKKTVLLVDANIRSREPRAKRMRTLGVNVDCADSISAARVRLAADKYNLILVDPGRDIEDAESLVDEIRAKNSRQLIQFLVGSPRFLATSLNGSSPRPMRTPAPIAAASVEKKSAPAARTFDFGQKIRDAELEGMDRKTGAV
jgi:hypothetical protein